MLSVDECIQEPCNVMAIVWVEFRVQLNDEKCEGEK